MIGVEKKDKDEEDEEGGGEGNEVCGMYAGGDGEGIKGNEDEGVACTETRGVRGEGGLNMCKRLRGGCEEGA